MSDELTPLTQTIARLAAPVPKPRVNLTRYHGVFAQNSKHHVLVTPAMQEEAEGPLWVDLGINHPGFHMFR